MEGLKNKIRMLCVVSGAALVMGALGVAALVKGIADRNQWKEQIAGLEHQLEEKQEAVEELEKELEAVLNDKPEVYLPDRLYVAVGRTLELYNNQVAFHGAIDEFAFNWECDIGKSLERKFQVTGETSGVGEHILKLTIYNCHLDRVYEKEVVLEVVENEIRDSIKILNIGDSFSDSTAWYGEVHALSGGKITFVGTRGTDDYKHEGRSGFSICDYRTETEYVYGGEGIQPFYNPDGTGFDFDYYKETTGVEPDVVQFFLGKNGMSMDPGPGIGWLMEMVQNVKENDPDMPIYLVQTIYLGDQNGIGNEVDRKGRSALNGWWKLEEDKQIMLWIKAMEEAFGSMEGVYLIPAALTFDSEYNFRAAIEPVNARSSRTEAVLKEGIHPNTEGYLQIADTLFNSYCGTMK